MVYFALISRKHWFNAILNKNMNHTIFYEEITVSLLPHKIYCKTLCQNNFFDKFSSQLYWTIDIFLIFRGINFRIQTSIRTQFKPRLNIKQNDSNHVKLEVTILLRVAHLPLAPLQTWIYIIYLFFCVYSSIARVAPCDIAVHHI